MTSTMRAADEFDKLKREQEQETRVPKLKRRKTLDWLVNGFEVVLLSQGDHDPPEADTGRLKEVSEKLIALLSGKIRSYDIKDLAVLLKQYDNDECPHALEAPAGAYLNECIRRCRDKIIELPIRDYSVAPDYIGSENDGKEIIVHGSVGWSAGSKMLGGKLTIRGNAGDVLGLNMEKGTIIVDGDAYGSVGFGMQGGLIVVKGKIKSFEDACEVGVEMTGGEVHVHGCTREEIYSYIVDGTEGANIYWRDEPIVLNGRFVEPR